MVKFRYRCDIIDYIADSSKDYDTDDFELYCAESGFEDWMSDYISDDDSPSECELNEIAKIQYEGFKQSHPEVDSAVSYGIYN